MTAGNRSGSRRSGAPFGGRSWAGGSAVLWSRQGERPRCKHLFHVASIEFDQSLVPKVWSKLRSAVFLVCFWSFVCIISSLALFGSVACINVGHAIRKQDLFKRRAFDSKPIKKTISDTNMIFIQAELEHTF